MVELFTSTGREFDSTIKSNATTGEEYCESTSQSQMKLKGQIIKAWFPYDRPGRLNIFFETTGTIGTIRTIIWKPGFTSTGRDLDYIREYLPALVHNQRSASFDKCVYSFSILFYDVTIHGFNNIIIWQGKSERSDWFFLGRDFAIRTVSVETVISCVFFVFESRKIQNEHGPSAI